MLLAHAAVGPKQRHNRRRKGDTRHGRGRRSGDERTRTDVKALRNFPRYNLKPATERPLPNFSRVQAREGIGWEENSLNVANENPLLVVSVAPALLSVRQSVDGLGGRSFDVFERAMRGLLK